MGSQRNTGAFIAGSVLGGMIGAAVALWKTPKSGPELRASLTGERTGAVTYRAEGGELTERRFANPVLGFVEKATAPIVGVELGKLAKDDPETYTAPVRASAADARPPSFVGETVTVASGTTEVTEPIGAVDPATAGAFAAERPAEEETHDPVEGSTAHAATTEELSSPTEEYVDELQHEHETEHIHTTGDFHFKDRPSGNGTH
jgi:hypothetical protein